MGLGKLLLGVFRFSLTKMYSEVYVSINFVECEWIMSARSFLLERRKIDHNMLGVFACVT